VRIYRTLGKSKVSKHLCSFQPSNSAVVNVELHQILRFKDSFSKQTSEVGPRPPLILAKGMDRKINFPNVYEIL
jgi:hypothetical protein